MTTDTDDKTMKPGTIVKTDDKMQGGYPTESGTEDPTERLLGDASRPESHDGEAFKGK
jgi:hypothetical protein